MNNDLKGPLVRSDILPSLRAIVEDIEQLKTLVGPIAEFHVVVDANILIREILWLLKGRLNPDATTDLQECIAAGTIIPYVTPSVISEVEEHLPQLAIKRGLDDDAWRMEWASYKQTLHIEAPRETEVAGYADAVDPDDAHSIVLAQMLSAVGILTRDKHIKAMGGRPISVEFVLEARDYSRKAAVSVSIKVGGYFLAFGVTGALQILVASIRQCGAWFSKLPDHIKILTLIAVAFVIVHPGTRDTVIAWLKARREALTGVLPQVLQLIGDVAEAAAKNQAIPPTIEWAG